MPWGLARKKREFAGHKEFDARNKKTVTRNCEINKNLGEWVKTSGERNFGNPKGQKMEISN